MQTAIITPKFVDAPKAGKKNATIKDTDSKLWLVTKTDMGNYQPGNTYEISYEEFDFKGTTFRGIKSGKLVSAAPAPHTNSGKYSATDPELSERIFVHGMVAATIGNSNVNPNEIPAAAYIQLVEKWRQVWRQTFGKAKGAVDDMNDEIPAEFR